MKIKCLDEKILQDEIKSVIKKSQEQSEQLNQLGYNVYERDVTSDIYKVENADNYFIYNGYLYVIYAYGNSNETSELDVVII